MFSGFHADLSCGSCALCSDPSESRVSHTIVFARHEHDSERAVHSMLPGDSDTILQASRPLQGLPPSTLVRD